MSTTYVKALAGIRAADVAFGGGKGAQLGELVAAGLPVPDGFVIGVPAYDEAVAENRIAPAPAESVRDAIVAHYRAMGDDVVVAVRSSAVAEDGVTASFAGIYQTVLNGEGTTQLLAAVRRCWASASAGRVRRYGGARRVQSADSGIAVVVQRQIDSACAGVAFTADPLTGRTDRIILEFAAGPGQAVVDGRVTPERAVVDKDSLDIVGAGNSTLSEKQIRGIARHAARIERCCGGPQDIEWAVDEQGRAWILQTRPITTLNAAVARERAVRFYAAPIPGGGRWTRVNIGEALPGVPTPLSWSVWSAGLNEGHRQSQVRLGVVADRDDRRAPVAALVRGWPALSVDLIESQLAQVPGMDVGAFSQQFFGAARRVQAAPVRARVGTALRMAARAPITLAVLQRRLRAVAAASRQAWQRDAWRPATDPVALLTEAATRFADTMTLHTLQTYVCQGLYQAVERVAGGSAIDLVSADGDLAEAHLAADLWLFARGRIALERFLFRHGFHGPDEGELAAPSWRQDPEPVRHAAQVWAEAGHSCDPRAALAQRREERRTVEAALCAALPPLRRPAVARLIAMARGAVVGREIGKAAFLQDLDVARHAVSFLREDAVWHTLGELQAGTRLGVDDVVARQRLRTHLAAREPPLSFVGDPGERLSGTAAAGVGGPSSVIAGVGASPGVVSGRARVVTDPAATIVLGAGDVLIAHTTDPSWVTRFMTVAGMAIDVGGVLSHAAIIARELGIPCVIGTGDGTRAIPEGALVEVDGSRGTVRILDADKLTA